MNETVLKSSGLLTRHSPIHASGREPLVAHGPLKVWRWPVDERAGHPRLVLRPARVAELGSEAGDEQLGLRRGLRHHQPLQRGRWKWNGWWNWLVELRCLVSIMDKFIFIHFTWKLYKFYRKMSEKIQRIWFNTFYFAQLKGEMGIQLVLELIKIMLNDLFTEGRGLKDYNSPRNNLPIFCKNKYIYIFSVNVLPYNKCIRWGVGNNLKISQNFRTRSHYNV